MKRKKPPQAGPNRVSHVASARLSGHAEDSRLERAAGMLRNPEPPVFPPKVGPAPSDSRRRANDADVQTSLQFTTGQGFLGFQFLAELSQIPEYRQISERLAQEMTRKWIRLRSRANDDKSERIGQLTLAMERAQLRERFREAAVLDGLFGRGHIYIDTGKKGPLILDPRSVPQGTKVKFHVVEPMFVYSYEYNADNPLDPYFYKPINWYVWSENVHHSRMLDFIARPVPAILRPAYTFSGLSMSQLSMTTVENFLEMRKNVQGIVRNFSLRGLKTNMEGILQGGTEDVDGLLARVKMYVKQAQSDGLMVLDQESEDFFQYTTPLTNLDTLLEQSRDNMCAIANIPKVVLFGLSPEGFNASADGEMQVFESYIAGVQETMFRSNLEKALGVLQLAEFGEIDPDIVVEFQPLREMSASDLASIRSMNAQSDKQYADIGAVTAEDVRKKLATDPTSGWDGLSAEMPEVEEVPVEQGV